MAEKVTSQEITEEQFHEEYEHALFWIQENSHLKKRLAEGGKEHYDYVCRCAAALVAMVNTHGLGQIPEDVDWQLLRGKQKGRPTNVRVSMTMAIDDLVSLTGLRELRKNSSVKKIDNYAMIMWQSSPSAEDRDSEECGKYNFITAYLVPHVQNVSDSRQAEYSWTPYGRAQERADLIDQLFHRWNKD